MRFKLNKITALVCATVGAIAFYASETQAQGEQPVSDGQARWNLQQIQDKVGQLLPIVSAINTIATNTTDIAGVVKNNLVATLTLLNNYLNSWVTPTDPDTISTELATNLSTYGAQLSASITAQSSADTFTKLNGSLLSPPTADPAASTTPPPIPNPEELTFSTLLGVPSANPTAAYNYILNASGISLNHVRPNQSWTGPDKKIYTSYFNTVKAVESFSGYVLNGIKTDGLTLNQAQKALVDQVSGPTWLATVQTENYYNVFRHLLMFESQIFMMMTQMVQLQKQLVTAQVMTNTLLIATSQKSNEQAMQQSAVMELQ